MTRPILLTKVNIQVLVAKLLNFFIICFQQSYKVYIKLNLKSETFLFHMFYLYLVVTPTFTTHQTFLVPIHNVFEFLLMIIS